MRRFGLLVSVIAISSLMTACTKAPVPSGVSTNVTTVAVTPTATVEERLVTNAYRPIVFSLGNYTKLITEMDVLGGSKDGIWYYSDGLEMKFQGKKLNPNAKEVWPNDDSQIVDTALVRGGESYLYYANNSLFGVGTASKPRFAIWAVSGDVWMSVQIKPIATKEQFIVGVNGEWNAVPRKPVQIGTDSYTIDLDNDGKQETLKILKTPLPAKTGEASAFDPGTEFKVVVVKEGKELLVERCTLLDKEGQGLQFQTLDLNGDGKLEIVLYERYDFQRLMVYELSGMKVKMVLGYDNGD